MKPFVPKYIADTLAALRAERHALQSRLDSLDLALENLGRVWPSAPEPVKVGKRAYKARVIADDSGAAARREVLLGLISKSSVGLSAGELRKQTPKMDAKDRGNALQRLKETKQIRRAGNAWVKAA